METRFVKIMLLCMSMSLSMIGFAQVNECQESVSALGGEMATDDVITRSTLFDFDDGTMQGWTTIDADGDGHDWLLSQPILGANKGHDGSYCCVLSQSFINNIGALTPDNYLVSPQITLGGYFSFFACAQDSAWAAEHFGVAVSTTSNTSASAFITIQEWTMNAKAGNPTKVTRDGSRQGTWYQYTVDLSNYEGQIGYVAIRHFNCTDMYFLDVDDVTIGPTAGHWYRYDNGHNKGGIGANGSFYWAVMFPAGSYQGGQVTKVALYDYDAFTGTVTIYNDGSTSPSNSVGSMNITCSGLKKFVEFEFPNPVNIDNAKNLWVVFFNVNSTQHPAAGSENTGDPNGRWISTNGTTWEDITNHNLDYTWNIRVFVDSGYLFYNIVATAAPSSGGNVSGAGTYAQGSTCTLTATPSSGYEFVRWTKDGSVAGYDPVLNITVTENATYVAHFNAIVNNYTISVGADPSAGGNVSGAGTYAQGSTCTLTATPNSGYGFVRWTKNGSIVGYDPVLIITVTENATYVAHFAVNNYNIAVSADPAEGGTVNGGGTYPQGSTCTLTAAENNGYSFVNWTKNGSVVSSEKTFSISVIEDASYVAHFSLLPMNYTVTVEANPAIGGMVSGGGTYVTGLSCTVTAVANESYTFSNWTENGVVVCQEPQYNFTVDRNRTLTANFNATPFYVISASCSANGSISPQGDIQVLAGTDQTFTITPDFGCLINKVLVDGVDLGSINTYTFSNVGANHTIYAMFSGWSVEESSVLGVRVYPNPVQDILSVEGEGIAEVQIYDLLGNKIRDLIVNNGVATIDLKNVPNGMYVVMITLENGIKCHQNIVLSNN